MDNSGNLQKSYTWGPGIDNLLAYTDHTTTNTYYMITDHLGTVHAVVNSLGSVVESYKYDAWGRVLGVYDSNGTPLSESAIGNNYLWQGRWYSWKTGLYFFRARWYDPITGRWLSKDPIGIAGGLNQYVFAGNNPVNSRDPLGLVDLNLYQKDSPDREERENWENAQRLKWQGVFTVAGHGLYADENDQIADALGDDVRGGQTAYSPEQIVDEMVRRGYKEGQNVYIVACNSGKASKSGKLSFAKRLYLALKKRSKSGRVGRVYGATDEIVYDRVYSRHSSEIWVPQVRILNRGHWQGFPIEQE